MSYTMTKCHKVIQSLNAIFVDNTIQHINDYAYLQSAAVLNVIYHILERFRNTEIVDSIIWIYIYFVTYHLACIVEFFGFQPSVTITDITLFHFIKIQLHGCKVFYKFQNRKTIPILFYSLCNWGALTTTSIE